MHGFLPLAFAALASAAPLSRRDDDPFVGTGTLNVVAGTATVGCLTDAMQYTTDTSQCGTFTGAKHENCDPTFGCGGYTWTLQTSAGPCAPIFHKGSQYEEGGNGVLTCGAAVQGSDKTAFSITGGVNGQIGMTLLEDSNGAASFNTIGGLPPAAKPQDLQDDLGLGAAVGTEFAITWTAQ